MEGVGQVFVDVLEDSDCLWVGTLRWLVVG